MSILVLAFLGLLQGLCEFLPISSSGHLVLFSKIFGVEDSLFVSILLHVATLFAVLIVLRKEIFYCIKHPFSKESMNVVVATIATCVIAIVLMPFITASFEGAMLPVFFLLSGVLLFLSERLTIRNRNKNINGEINLKRAFMIGLAQGLAIFPGLSRSGTTISCGLLSGGGKEESAKFSFIISLPIIAGSMLLEIIKITQSAEPINVNVPGMIISFIIAFVVGIITIKYMINLTKRLNFKYFAIYLIIMSIISAIILW